MLALSNASLRRSSLPSEKALPIPLLITLSYGLRTQRIRFDPFLPFVLFVYGLSAHRQFRMRQCTKAPLEWRLTRRRAALVVWLRGAHHLQFPGASSLPADGTVRPRDARCRGRAAHVLGGLRQPGRQTCCRAARWPGDRLLTREANSQAWWRVALRCTWRCLHRGLLTIASQSVNGACHT